MYTAILKLQNTTFFLCVLGYSYPFPSGKYEIDNTITSNTVIVSSHPVVFNIVVPKRMGKDRSSYSFVASACAC